MEVKDLGGLVANGHNVTIHSQGTGRDTVLIGESGEQLKNITSLDVHIEADELTTVSLEVRGIATIINGTVTEIRFVCPCCGETYDHDCDNPDSSMVRAALPQPWVGLPSVPPAPNSGDMKCWNKAHTITTEDVYCDAPHHHPSHHTGVLASGSRVRWPVLSPTYASNPCAAQHPSSRDPSYQCLLPAGHDNSSDPKEMHRDPTGASWSVR